MFGFPVNSSCSPRLLRSASRRQCCSFNVTSTWKSINFPMPSSGHWQCFVFENAFKEIKPFQSLDGGRNSSKSPITEHLVGCFWQVFDMSQKLTRGDWMFNWLEFVTEKDHRDFGSADTRVVWSLAEKHPTTSLSEHQQERWMHVSHYLATDDHMWFYYCPIMWKKHRNFFFLFFKNFWSCGLLMYVYSYFI